MYKLRSGFYVAFLALLLIVLPLSAMAQQSIREIRVEGAQRVEAATIISYMDLNVGDLMTRSALDRSLKSLFSTGLFADVSLDSEGSVLTVSVVENPLINQIVFEGNDQLEDGELLAEIQLRPRQVFTRTKVQSDIARLFQIYRRDGRFSADIEPKLIKLDQNRVNLIFEIDEGPVTTVKSIRFVGNEHFSDSKLRSEVSTKETAWYRFISSDDRYDPDRLAYDQELLRRYYLSQGYADFRLLSAVAELSNNKEHFFVTFTIEEGERYRIGDVKIDSRIQHFDSSVLNQYVTLEIGEWYNADLVQENIDKITEALGDLQYAFVNIRPNVERLREQSLVNITFQVNETPRVFVERINVNGNMRTLDKVVRREVSLAEGDPFNRSKLERSEQNVKNLNFFETVEIGVSRGSAPDKTVLDIDVTEKSTGEISVGAGYSSSYGPLADLRIRERNLLGKGQDLLLATTLAAERTEFNLSFTEPHFLDRDLSAGIDIFHVTRDLQDESSYDQRRTGGEFRIGYPLSERWRQSVRYRIERNELTDVKDTASRFILDQEGERDTSTLSQRLTYDSRDSILFPTNGWFYWLDTEIAGLGGDAKYLSAKTGASWFYPLADRWILNFLGEVAAIESYADKDVEINERFFLGGSSLRGFERSGVGPRDEGTRDALGGNFFYRGTAEMSFPIGLPEELGVLGHTFSDFGSLWDVDDTGSDVLDESSLRASVGFGISWRSPFGPVRVDFAQPIADQNFDQKETFRFNFGTRF